MQKQIKPFGLRMPDSLRAWVRETARRENRSANSQIVHLLEKAKEKAAGGDLAGQTPAAENDNAALQRGASINRDTGDVADE